MSIMEACTISSVDVPTQSMGQSFVNPLLNTVWILAFYFVLPKKWPCLEYLVDIIASVWLLYGTILRKVILDQTNWMIDICAAMYASNHTVYQFLATSLACWVASCILECRSLRFLSKISLGDIRRLNMSWKSKLLCFLALLASFNSCWVMYNYSVRVHRSFQFVSEDRWVFYYYILAAFSKNLRVIFQGLIFTSRVGQPWQFLTSSDTSKCRVMSRMAFSNFVMLVQSCTLLCWTWQWNTMTLLSVLDIMYRFVVILWFVANSSALVKKTDEGLNNIVQEQNEWNKDEPRELALNGHHIRVTKGHGECDRMHTAES